MRQIFFLFLIWAVQYLPTGQPEYGAINQNTNFKVYIKLFNKSVGTFTTSDWRYHAKMFTHCVVKIVK